MKNKLCVIVLALVMAGDVSHATTTGQSSSRESLLERVNRERKKNGCPPLRENKQLSKAAQDQAQAMQKKQYFNHVAPDGDAPDHRASRRGYRYAQLSENIAAGQERPDQVVDGWLKSKPHRQAMLNCRYREAGTGHHSEKNDKPFPGEEGAYYDYWAQVYAEPGEGRTSSRPKKRS